MKNILTIDLEGNVVGHRASPQRGLLHRIFKARAMSLR